MDLEEAEMENYEVFLSFRGPDTRQGFTDVLYDHMIRAGIRVFRDDDELAIGDEIDKILVTINNSQICVPIFSKTFAQSKWCLKEVMKMVELNKVVVPIFYDVTPDDVKLKTPVYSKFIRENEWDNEVRDWVRALKAIAKIKGREVKQSGHVEFCKKFIEEVLNKLKPTKRYNIDPLVGIEHQLDYAMKLLDLDKEFDDVRYISIHGMGGIGKTTLAKTIFNKISRRFTYASFMENIRECSSGHENLRRKLNVSLDPTSSTSRDASERFRKERVLLILDDVDKTEQIKELIEEPSWLGSGSRVIVTTRRTDILTKYARPYGKLDIYSFEMKPLEKEHALELFSRYAFGKASPPADFSALSEEAVLCADGLPLALTVIASTLCTYKKDMWLDVIARLKDIPAKEVKEKLKISYDTLEDGPQQIFLDIACFLNISDTSHAYYMWESCKFYPTYALEVLKSMCLIKTTGNNEIWVHDQLRDLGRDIVREESIQHPAKRSRLWAVKEAREVLMSRKEGKQTVQALCMDKPLVNTLTDEHLDSFRGMRLLALTGGNFRGKMKDLLGNLTWLDWRYTPADFNLSNFSVKKLVILNLSFSSVDEDWPGWSQIQMAHNLKVLDLENCHRLTRTPDFDENNSLERLSLSQCSRLATIGSSIRNLRRLKFLDLKGCTSLRDFPEELCSLTDLQEILMRGCGPSAANSLSSPEYIDDIKSFRSHRLRAIFTLETIPKSLGDLKSLTVLDLSGCWGLSELPDSIGGLVKLKELSLGECVRLKKLPDSLWKLTSLLQLDLSYTQIGQLPNSVGYLKELRLLNISRCQGITTLPASIGSLKKLVDLNAGLCHQLEEIPVEIGQLSYLERLNLSHSAIRTLPSTICQLSHLQVLNIECCRQLEELPELPRGLTELRAPARCMKRMHDQSQLGIISSMTITSIHDLQEIQRFPTRLKTLKGFLWNSHTLPFDLSSFAQLENLTLIRESQISNCRLPIGLSGLKNLSYLQFFNFSEGEDAGFKSLGVREMENLRSVVIFKCSCYVIELCLARTLTALVIKECISLSKLPDLSHLKALSHLDVYYCTGLTEILGLEELESLSSLSIAYCTSIKRIGDLSKLKNLSTLCIENCYELTRTEGTENLFTKDLSIMNCPQLSYTILPEKSRGSMETLSRTKRWSWFACLGGQNLAD